METDTHTKPPSTLPPPHRSLPPQPYACPIQSDSPAPLSIDWQTFVFRFPLDKNTDLFPFYWNKDKKIKHARFDMRIIRHGGLNQVAQSELLCHTYRVLSAAIRVALYSVYKGHFAASTNIWGTWIQKNQQPLPTAMVSALSLRNYNSCM